MVKSMERLQQVVNGEHKNMSMLFLKTRSLTHTWVTQALHISVSSMSTMKSRLEMIARQQGCGLVFLYRTIKSRMFSVKLRQLIFSVFTSNLNQNGVSRHRGHVLPDSRPVLPGGGAASMWSGRGCEGCPARRLTPCKRSMWCFASKPHFMCVITKLLTCLAAQQVFPPAAQVRGHKLERCHFCWWPSAPFLTLPSSREFQRWNVAAFFHTG